MPETDFLLGFLQLVFDGFVQYGLRCQCGNQTGVGIHFGFQCQQAHSLASGWSNTLCKVGKISLGVLFFFWFMIRDPKIISESLKTQM